MTNNDELSPKVKRSFVVSEKLETLKFNIESVADAKRKELDMDMSEFTLPELLDNGLHREGMIEIIDTRVKPLLSMLDDMALLLEKSDLRLEELWYPEWRYQNHCNVHGTEAADENTSVYGHGEDNRKKLLAAYYENGIQEASLNYCFQKIFQRMNDLVDTPLRHSNEGTIKSVYLFFQRMNFNKELDMPYATAIVEAFKQMTFFDLENVAEMLEFDNHGNCFDFVYDFPENLKERFLSLGLIEKQDEYYLQDKLMTGEFYKLSHPLLTRYMLMLVNDVNAHVTAIKQGKDSYILSWRCDHPLLAHWQSILEWSKKYE